MSEPWLMLGDCLERMSEIPDGSVDMVLCDLPYGTTACKWDSVIPFEPLWSAYRRVTKPSAAIVLFAQQPFTTTLIASQMGAFRQALVWKKNKASGHLNAHRRHMTIHEDVVLFSFGTPLYNPQRSTGHKPANFAARRTFTPVYGRQRETEYEGGNTDRLPNSVLDFSVVNNDGSGDGRFHPTQKPIPLLEYLIRTYTNEGETVLDNTMGSGSTGVACANTNRRFIGIERDPGYFEIAQRRIAEAAKQPALL